MVEMADAAPARRTAIIAGNPRGYHAGCRHGDFTLGGGGRTGSGVCYSYDSNRPPVAHIGIKHIAEVNLLPSIPHDYVEYIKSTGPFECLTQEDAEPGYVVLWSFDEIAKNNSDIEIEMHAPGFIAFGGNGGGELLVFDGPGAVFMLPMIGMEPGCAIRIAEDFQELVSRLEI